MAGLTAEATSRALNFFAPACNWQALHLAPCLEISYPERGSKKKKDTNKNGKCMARPSLLSAWLSALLFALLSA